jgi:type II secretory pathway component GspD/PulD (secretin)
MLLACLLAALLLLPVLSTPAGAATITGVKVMDGTGTLKVEVRANGSVQYSSKVVQTPRPMLVFDVWPATLGSGVKPSVEVNRGLVEKVRVSQLKPGTVRLYVDVITVPQYKVMTTPGAGLTVAISTAQMAQAKAPSASATSAQEPTTTPPPVAAQPRPQPRPQATPRPQARPRPAATQPVVTAQAGETSSALRARRPRTRPAPRPKMVSLDFVNADLVYVIKVLAKEMNKNVAILPGTEGAVTVTLKNVPVEGALALILKMQETDLDYKAIDNTIVVGPPDKLANISDDILGQVKAPSVPREAVTAEFTLENAPAAKIIEFLQKQYPNVQFTPHPTINGFFARGSKQDLASIRGQLATLDVVEEPPPPPRREFIPIHYGDIREIMTLLKTLVPDVTMNVDTRLNLLIVEGSDAAIAKVQELLTELDRPVGQVMMDVKVVDLSETGSKDLGVSLGDVNAGQGVFITTFAEATAIGATAASTTFLGLPIQPFSRSPFVLEATLNFLISQSEAKIMAAPRVAGQSGKSALIHVGDKFPIVYFDPRAGQFQVTYVDIGIKFNVKPEVKRDGYVVTEIQPEVSNLVELINNQYPRTAVRTVNTTMRIKDGDTVIIGGLIREDDRRAVTKIPLLGDLPILGNLFRTMSHDTTRNEVVLMFTPHIMRDANF